jgi:solute carrier family 25 (mitochondrial folate transporter), member 32
LIFSFISFIQVRQQAQGSLHGKKRYSGAMQTFRSILEQEGPRGLFKGMGTALINVPLFWGIYWTGYENLKKYFHQETNLILPVQHILSATMAGALADVISNPFWVVRTRIQTQILHPERHLPSTPSTLSMFRYIYQHEGFFAFYRGLSASLLGLTHVAIQFPLYEHLKELSRTRRGATETTAIDHFFASVTAKIVASSITYPHEVLRVRLQDTERVPSCVPLEGRQHQSNSSLQMTRGISSTLMSFRPLSLLSSSSLVLMTKKIIREEGVKALWSGFRISMIRVIPSTTTSFLTYEYVTKLLRNGDQR